MLPIRFLLTAMLLGASSLGGPTALAQAAPSPVSVHVLDQQTGKPSSDLAVILEKRQGSDWVFVGQGRTDPDGRLDSLYPAGKALAKADYRITFKTGEWFDKRHMDTFYPEVTVVIRADGSVPYYHVPLLLSPFSYTTYRGS